MKTGNIVRRIFILQMLLLLVGCSRSFVAVAPVGFATYDKGSSFKSVSAERIVYRVRTCRNKPYADFEFWREALPERMKNAGYRIIRDSVITVEEKPALLLEMAAPVGDADYSYIVMMAVRKKIIIIGEAAGAYADMQKQKPTIVAALQRVTVKK